MPVLPPARSTRRIASSESGGGRGNRGTLDLASSFRFVRAPPALAEWNLGQADQGLARSPGASNPDGSMRSCPLRMAAALQARSKARHIDKGDATGALDQQPTQPAAVHRRRADAAGRP